MNDLRLKVNFDCRKITSVNIHDAPEQILQNSSEILEKIKQSKKFQRIVGEAYPVIIIIENPFDFDIVEFSFQAKAFFKGDNEDDQFLIEFNQSGIKVESKQIIEITLFDGSGLSEVLVQLNSVKYQDNNKRTLSDYTTNSPYLINFKDFRNEFNGFSSLKEMQIYLLLDNYKNDSLPSRIWLLTFMFNLLEDVKSKKIELQGKTSILTENDLIRVRTILQLDIIAKIMMSIEDMAILLTAIISSGGNYYELLDRKEPDVGERITLFFDNIQNLKFEDLRRMLSYINPNELKLEESQTAVLEKLIQSNVEKFKIYLKQIQKFRVTHTQIFRRYKHAGLPIRLGIKFDKPFLSSSNAFDSYAMVSIGNDPLVDILPLPYSNNVIKSYSKLISILQFLLLDIIQNKIAIIIRRINGILPLETYGELTLTDKEQKNLQLAIKQFYQNNPVRSYDNHFQFKAIAQTQKLKWYLELDDFLNL